MGGDIKEDIMEVKEIHRKSTAPKLPPERFEELVKKMKKEHEKLVKGMFEFIDAQGGWLDFSYRFFKDDPLTTIHLVHGEITELPMGIVKHLNNTKKKIRKMSMELNPNERGMPMQYEVQSRVRFTPMDVL